MRLNVSISGLLACLMGLSAADRPNKVRSPSGPGLSGTSQNSVVLVDTTTPFPVLAAFSLSDGDKNIKFMVNNQARIIAVKLKRYNTNEAEEKTIDLLTLQSPDAKPPNPGGKVMVPSDERGLTRSLVQRDDVLTAVDDDDLNSVTIAWNTESGAFSKYIDQSLYLECEWKNSSASGSSTSPLFAAYDDTNGQAAKDNLLKDSNNSPALPARPETINPSLSPTLAPTPVTPISSTLGSSTPSPSATSSQPGLSDEQPPPSPARSGLGKNGIIGVAVGVTVGGLLILGTLAWLFFYRRRSRNNKAHHAMPSYSSDVGVHAMMPDKEMPVAMESSPRSAYGGEGRPSTDPYAPYSDRASTPPTPHHPTTGATAAATTQTDASTRSVTTPTPAIAARYAHLVEEGMTEDEIRRLEEEERQLDAAIEHAGRRGGTP
ncbi:hypothetical protein HD806DRAFT_478936 [Xylariaceae sp. AK1471]|nr:hypothetical protein HD806DRAFT_478936 [Xylariaceae sp. AK1471]